MDGGLDNGIGYYRWVVVSDQKILWENKGHAQGKSHQIEILRIEGIGLLSVVIFLCHCTLCHHIRVNMDRVIHYCDNMGVVKQI
eukprot:11868894-Ditylum_brightwellii.AAC.1